MSPGGSRHAVLQTTTRRRSGFGARLFSGFVLALLLVAFTINTRAVVNLLAIPDCSLLASIAGILLLYAEFNVPGSVLPGCLGALLLMLGIFGLSRMPLRPWAFGLILFGLALLWIAILNLRPLLPGALAVATLAAGALRLVDARRYGSGVALPSALLGALTFSATTICLGRIALLARRNKQLRPASNHPAPQSRLNNSDLR